MVPPCFLQLLVGLLCTRAEEEEAEQQALAAQAMQRGLAQHRPTLPLDTSTHDSKGGKGQSQGHEGAAGADAQAATAKTSTNGDSTGVSPGAPGSEPRGVAEGMEHADVAQQQWQQQLLPATRPQVAGAERSGAHEAVAAVAGPQQRGLAVRRALLPRLGGDGGPFVSQVDERFTRPTGVDVGAWRGDLKGPSRTKTPQGNRAGTFSGPSFVSLLRRRPVASGPSFGKRRVAPVTASTWAAVTADSAATLREKKQKLAGGPIGEATVTGTQEQEQVHGEEQEEGAPAAAGKQKEPNQATGTRAAARVRVAPLPDGATTTLQQHVYRLAVSRGFEYGTTVIIVLNAIGMALTWYVRVTLLCSSRMGVCAAMR